MILVVGGTGELGGRVVALLRGRGEAVRALVRPRTDDGDLRALGAQTVRGDLTDPASLRVACVGVDTVVSTATAITRRLSGAGGPSIKEVDDVGMAVLISSAQEAGVGRFVYVSYAGVEAGLGYPLERAKLATERRLRASSMRVSIVRPAAYQEIHLGPIGRFDLRAGKVSVFGRGDCAQRWISTDDVAALVAAVAVEPDASALIEVGGPEAMSRNEAIAVAEGLTGRAMKRQSMPRSLTRLAMRILDRPNPALASIFGSGLLIDMVGSRADDSPLRESGIEPRSATAFLEQQARSLG